MVVLATPSMSDELALIVTWVEVPGDPGLCDTDTDGPVLGLHAPLLQPYLQFCPELG